MAGIIPIASRKIVLQKLLLTIKIEEKQILEALYKDFKKPYFETYITEIDYVIKDLKYTIKNLKNWSKPESVWPSILNFPSREYIYKEPYGRVLIISPWNYPFQLAITPLVAAIAAGNSVVLKPSEMAHHTAEIITKIIQKVFDINQVLVVQGDANIASQLLQEKWDYIFFTGSSQVGKIVAKAAAINLTPCTLELGGKNPCIVDENCNLEIAAKRIVWGKFVNAGQTCIAPDYLLVHHKEKYNLIQLLIKEIELAYTQKPEDSESFARIINHRHVERLQKLIVHENIIYGGKIDMVTKFIAPTLVDEPSLESLLMQDEIFGPILPIIGYETVEDIEKIVLKYEKPLALYVFSNNKKWAENIINKFSFGGGCINDTMIQFLNKRLPFGGVGHSGLGSYHGKFSFNTFSHQKSIVKKGFAFDIPLRYAPYKSKLQKFKKLLSWI
jgi:aldehyde dehydrogenase (NAD+)